MRLAESAVATCGLAMGESRAVDGRMISPTNCAREAPYGTSGPMATGQSLVTSQVVSTAASPTICQATTTLGVGHESATVSGSVDNGVATSVKTSTTAVAMATVATTETVRYGACNSTTAVAASPTMEGDAIVLSVTTDGMVAISGTIRGAASTTVTIGSRRAATAIATMAAVSATPTSTTVVGVVKGCNVIGITRSRVGRCISAVLREATIMATMASMEVVTTTAGRTSQVLGIGVAVSGGTATIGVLDDMGHAIYVCSVTASITTTATKANGVGGTATVAQRMASMGTVITDAMAPTTTVTIGRRARIVEGIGVVATATTSTTAVRPVISTTPTESAVTATALASTTGAIGPRSSSVRLAAVIIATDGH